MTLVSLEHALSLRCIQAQGLVTEHILAGLYGFCTAAMHNVA
jgi:hypothetical protein